jgi:CubicO group peptidase (beta-lactamase class C family)
VNKRIQTGLAWVAGAIGTLIAFIVGLFVYMNATATPLHPDAKAVASVTSPSSPQWAAAVEQSRQTARSGVVTQNLPGLSVAVGIGGEIVWAEGFGEADLEKRITVTPETRFRIGETSMPITSAAVGLLLEKNKLNLDADIQRYVPAFPEKQWPVTLRQVMAHQSGLRNDEGDEESLAPCERTGDGLQRFAGEPLRFEPGTRYRFSTYGWILVSAAVEAAGGEPFFNFMRTQIFEPLGMTGTRPDIAAEAMQGRATFYFPRFGGDTRYGPDLAREGDHSCFAGARGFLSTPSDMVRYAMAIRSGKLLQPATVDLLQTAQRLSSGDETEYGLGWQLENVDLGGKPARMAGHGTKRDFIGGTASLATFPERGMAVAVVTNISFADTKSIAVKVAQAFAQPGAQPGVR